MIYTGGYLHSCFKKIEEGGQNQEEAQKYQDFISQGLSFYALMIASIFLAVLSLIRILTSGPDLKLCRSSRKYTKNYWLILMFLQFERFSRTSYSVTDQLSLALRISCACLMEFCPYSKISQNPHFLRMLTQEESQRLAIPKRMTRIFLFLMPDDIKIFHMRWANFQGQVPSQLYLTRISFLIVTTACFWKL